LQVKEHSLKYKGKPFIFSGVILLLAALSGSHLENTAKHILKSNYKGLPAACKKVLFSINLQHIA